MTRTTAYYNEIDPYAAQWLRNLIDAGHIAPGVVDTRSIEDVTPHDLHGFTQCHFFAGIGGWSLALRLADWPDDRPVWTGSCPCQPFSAAGKSAGFADERHLWPAWFHLLEQCRPPVVFGEQVASKAVDAWIDLVHTDLEGVGYGFGSIPFPAAGVGAPHIRDRNYWVAHSENYGYERPGQLNQPPGRHGAAYGYAARGLADAHGWHAGAERLQRGGEYGQQPEDGGVVRLADTDRAGCLKRQRDDSSSGHRDTSPTTGVDDRPGQSGPTNGLWRAADWLACRDGKWRPVEPGTFPLAHGVSGRVGRLRAYGNAIVPQQAAEFIRAAIG